MKHQNPTTRELGSSQIPREATSRLRPRPWLPLLCGAFLVVLRFATLGGGKPRKYIFETRTARARTGPSSRDPCPALTSHEDGRWRHVSYDPGSAGGLSNGTRPDGTLDAMSDYYPVEREWLRGPDPPRRFDRAACHEPKEEGTMYLSQLGNQCGCSTRLFEPTHSTWVSGRAAERPRASSAVRLVRALARSEGTLCFLGDSVDHQFYDALAHGLQRAAALRELHGGTSGERLNITMHSTQVPVEYTDETGHSIFGTGFRALKHIHRTEVTINEIDSAAFQYIKFYGWSPMHLSFTDECSIVIANLGAHYNETTGKLSNANSHLSKNYLHTDFPALVGWLLDFASVHPRRRVVWRSALPQHFDTRDGHYRAESRRCAARPGGRARGAPVQRYNRAYDRLFDALCGPADPAGCPYKRACAANRTDGGLASLHRYYVRSGCCAGRRARLERAPRRAEGTILRWEVADLFDVAAWHADDGDCTHFCYVPSLYEAAFERLLLLLT